MLGFRNLTLTSKGCVFSREKNSSVLFFRFERTVAYHLIGWNTLFGYRASFQSHFTSINLVFHKLLAFVVGSIIIRWWILLLSSPNFSLLLNKWYQMIFGTKLLIWWTLDWRKKMSSRALKLCHFKMNLTPPPSPSPTPFVQPCFSTFPNDNIWAFQIV